MSITAVSTLGMSREDWLQRRKGSIGGSDAAAIVGLSRWSSPYSVWADKTGRVPDKEDNEAMRQGRDLEEYVARRFTEATGKKVRRRNAMLYNSKYPFAHADVDRLVDGERAGLECKTTTALDAMKRFSSGAEFPERYYVQCVHYLMVTGLERWYLAVLVLGKGFFTFVLDRDEAEIAALAEAEAAFWRHVTEDTPPEVDGMEATQDAISAIYAEGGGGRVPLVGRDGLLTEREALKAQVTALTERISEIEATIKSDMGEAEEAESDGWRVTWRVGAGRRTLNTDKLLKDYPGMELGKYYDIGKPTRTFRVKKMDK